MNSSTVVVDIGRNLCGGFVLNSIGFKTLVYHCGAVVVGFNFTSVGDCILFLVIKVKRIQLVLYL